MKGGYVFKSKIVGTYETDIFPLWIVINNGVEYPGTMDTLV